jgi:LacI family transcriptional regulator
MDPVHRKPSIKDVATLAGVSLGSVSRVINGVANVTPEVREKVHAAMTQLDYRLNHAARTLRSRSSRTVGCMLTDVTNPLYARLYRVFEEQFRAAGYMVMLANGLNQLEWELDILAMFRSRGMDGVILAPGFERHARVRTAIDSLGIPAVVLDRDIASHQDQVLFDHAAGVKAAVQHLLALGHRRVALIVGATNNRPMRRRIDGYRAGLATLDLKPDPALIVRLSSATVSAERAVGTLLARPRAGRPTAIVTLGTSVLADVLNGVSAAGLQVPHDISVVSMGEPDFVRSHQPAISSVVVDLEDAAVQSCQLLLQRMRGQTHLPPRRVMLPTVFIARGSVGPAPQPRS